MPICFLNIPSTHSLQLADNVRLLSIKTDELKIKKSYLLLDCKPLHFSYYINLNCSVSAFFVLKAVLNRGEKKHENDKKPVFSRETAKRKGDIVKSWCNRSDGAVEPRVTPNRPVVSSCHGLYPCNYTVEIVIEIWFHLECHYISTCALCPIYLIAITSLSLLCGVTTAAEWPPKAMVGK